MASKSSGTVVDIDSTSSLDRSSATGFVICEMASFQVSEMFDCCINCEHFATESAVSALRWGQLLSEEVERL